jgi:peptidoglycan/LPS O-acetylase OafA/YrhL
MLVGAIAFAGDVLGFAQLIAVDRARFIFFFFAGATFFALRERIVLRAGVAAACAAAVVSAGWLTSDHHIHRLVLAAALPYLAFWVGFVPGGTIRRFNEVGDYSYGTYILAGPVQLVLAMRFGVTAPIENFAVALLLVLPLAALSWHLIESRALSLPVPAIFDPLRRARPAPK